MTRLLVLLAALAMGHPAWAQQLENVTPLKCPSGTALQRLESERGTIEFCATPEGQLDGPAREWYPSGQQRTQDNWLQGDKNGIWIVWDEKGIKREERTFQRGKQVGIEMTWHDNGLLRTQVEYRGGLKHGAVQQWDDVGRQIVQGQFRNALEDGAWTLWDFERGMRKEMTFRKGKVSDAREHPLSPPASREK